MIDLVLEIDDNLPLALLIEGNNKLKVETQLN